MIVLRSLLAKFLGSSTTPGIISSNSYFWAALEIAADFDHPLMCLVS